MEMKCKNNKTNFLRAK